MKLNELAKQIHENAKDKGFYDKPLETGTLLMLIVSELSEALEADRIGSNAQIDEFKKNFADIDVPEIENKDTYSKMFFEDSIKDTFEDELADTVIRVLDLCAYKGIDIEWHIKQKVKYNSTRENLHGKKY